MHVHDGSGVGVTFAQGVFDLLIEFLWRLTTALTCPKPCASPVFGSNLNSRTRIHAVTDPSCRNPKHSQKSQGEACGGDVVKVENIGNVWIHKIVKGFTMQFLRQFVIALEACKIYAAFEDFTKLSPQERCASALPTKLPGALKYIYHRNLHANMEEIKCQSI